MASLICENNIISPMLTLVTLLVWDHFDGCLPQNIAVTPVTSIALTPPSIDPGRFTHEVYVPLREASWGVIEQVQGSVKLEKGNVKVICGGIILRVNLYLFQLHD